MRTSAAKSTICLLAARTGDLAAKKRNFRQNGIQILPFSITTISVFSMPLWEILLFKTVLKLFQESDVAFE